MHKIELFDTQKYFKNLGSGWRFNYLTGSIFYENNEIEINKRIYRIVLLKILQAENGLDVFEFLKKTPQYRWLTIKEDFLSGFFLNFSRAMEESIGQYGFKIEQFKQPLNEIEKWRITHAH